jgi:chemotaxis protein MotB
MEAIAAEHQKALEANKAQYDAMVGKLQGELSSGKIEIEQMRDGINVNLAQDILFKSGSADLDKTGRELLLKVADNLKASPYQVIVTGHTDNQKIGGALAKKYPTNWELGAARAAQIVRVFEGAGIGKDRLAAVSFSDSRPRDPNETNEGRARNRRIEIRLRPAANEQTAGSN